MKRKLLLLSAFVAVIALAAFWATPRTGEATTFNPFFGPTDFYTITPTTPNTATDLHAQFNVFAPSANFSGLFGRAITFGDRNVFTASAADVPGTGAYIGSLSSVATLGLANEGCNSTVPVTFNFVESSVDGGGTASTAARPFTNPAGGMQVGAGGIPASASGTKTDWTYVTAGGVDPLGLKQNTGGVAGYEGGPGLGPANPGPTDEGNALVGVNEIRVDSEEMLVVGVDYTANQYRVIRGWNGTATALHNAGAQVLRVPVIYPNGPSSNLLANLAEDDGDLDNNGVPEEAAGLPGGTQFNGNQVADGADALPSFVRNSLDPDQDAQNGGYVQLRARYAGVAFVANSLIVILQFAIGELGGLQTFPQLDWATANWGYPTVTFLQDPNAPPSDSAITDFCNFSSNTAITGITHDNLCTGASPPGACTGTGAGFTLRLAVDGGCPGATTPNECGSVRARTPATTSACGGQPAGWTSCSVRYYQYAVSQRDYDNDGHENALDTCPYNPNASWDPRAFNASSGGDTDGDGLPDVCDPTPTVPIVDQDNDGGGTGWLNRIDNCPTVPNVSVSPPMVVPNQMQFDMDVSPGTLVPDGGPNSDSIGPECDVAANSCASPCVGQLTPTGANGHYHAAFAAQTICIGAVTNDCNATAGLAGGASDPDNDGVVSASDTCIGGFNPPQGSTGPAGQDTTTAAAIAGTNTVTVGSTAGFVQGQPIEIGWDPANTGPLPGAETLRWIDQPPTATTIHFTPALSGGHASGIDVRQVAFAQSIRDANNNGTVGVIDDITQLTGRFGTQGGNPQGLTGTPPGGNYVARFDVNNDSFIDVIGDISKFTQVFSLRCGPS